MALFSLRPSRGRLLHLARIAPTSCSYSTDRTSKSWDEYTVSVLAEPLHRYCTGGYHPVHIGDVLHDGRYEILNKLGFGGHSTVWAAHDRRTNKFVSLKISVAELTSRRGPGEAGILQALAASKLEHEGSRHVVSMSDNFEIEGPNGRHGCLVLDLVGPSVWDFIENRYRLWRLPASSAKVVAKQVLLGLDYLHQNGVVHGDLHTNNVAFAVTTSEAFDKDDFSRRLPEPYIGEVKRKDGGPIEACKPRYLVEADSFRVEKKQMLDPMIKIIDLGEAFFEHDAPRELWTSLAVRPPEVIFGDALNRSVDLWAMGCLLFEAYLGQPTFSSLFATPKTLVDEILDVTGEKLPVRWEAGWRTLMATKPPRGEDDILPRLEQWMQEVYFNEHDEDQKMELTKDEVYRLCKTVKRLLKLEPGSRDSVKEILEDDWFR